MTDQVSTAIPSPTCRWCGNLHGPQCPNVRAIEFYQDGVTVKRVEFHPPAPVNPYAWKDMVVT